MFEVCFGFCMFSFTNHCSDASSASQKLFRQNKLLLIIAQILIQLNNTHCKIKPLKLIING